MSDVSHSATMRNNIAQSVLDLIDVDAGPGDLVIKTAGDAVLSTLVLQDPAGSVTGPTLTFTAPNDDTNAAGTGVAAKFDITDNTGDVVVSGDVTTVADGTGDLLLSDTSITTGDTVAVSALSYTAPV